MHLKEFDRLVTIMKRLRKECPWDREQTPESLRQYLLEEAYETIEAIGGGNWGGSERMEAKRLDRSPLTI